MSLLQINNAVPLAEPLLEQQQEESNDGKKKQQQQCEYAENSNTKFVILGAITGFFIQVVSLGAYAFLLVQYKTSSPLLQVGEQELPRFEGPEVTALKESGIFGSSASNTRILANTTFGTSDAILYTILSVLTQIDLVVYVLIWVAFTCTMTRNGMACIRSQFFVSSSSSGNNQEKATSKTKHQKLFVQRRYVFVLGVNFLVGIVLGAFCAWSAVDVYLGFPIPFQPIIATVAVDLGLCYLMVWCYDMGGKKRRKFEGSSGNEFLQLEFDDECEDDRTIYC
mmetsp:Transcript_24221/g.53370  ORF Transcript_24221/g.53370 Transcript_24221/m.53370 type:complete len:281 (+) Transcript_24221:274-1116(+)|eukprot:CAMPEP_0201132686 /NCGR_PEP_ID=MMETSP0850-20130426/46508_1 /ASSEMBLY_ACC=CAM_ASM_000622 /TAXON_ID=183588 /ORGANISM="Pseudo-nitzschia fraudulenta, Strain WWA7" /LENGTH=280 /DNA_ID=CAMNT_0047403081 /DNA_START=157 /DNA_END=999 /DNA_ORIENTATION=-